MVKTNFVSMNFKIEVPGGRIEGSNDGLRFFEFAKIDDPDVLDRFAGISWLELYQTALDVFQDRFKEVK